MTNIRVEVEGLATVRRQLSALGQAEDRAELRRGLKAAAGIVAEEAKRRLPSRSGRARASLRAQAAGNRALVVGGKSTVPYYGWLDFGSRNPRSGQPRTVGPWASTGAGPAQGRAIYPALDDKRREVEDAVDEAMGDAISALGLD